LTIVVADLYEKQPNNRPVPQALPMSECIRYRIFKSKDIGVVQMQPLVKAKEKILEYQYLNVVELVM
jgi:hypothetical protein